MKDKLYMKKKETREVNITCINTIFVLFFTISVLAVSVNIFIIDDLIFRIIILIFIIITYILIYFFSIRRILYNFKVRKHGKIVDAKVVGYIDDNYSINNKKTQIIILSLKTPEGEKNIYYQSGETEKKYKIDSNIKLFVYKDLFLIKNEKINKREKIMGIMVLFLLGIIVCLYSAFFVVYCILNTTFNQIKNDIYKNNNMHIMREFNGLEYKIPEDYKLFSYKVNYNYSFKSKNDTHFCEIKIYDLDVKRDERMLNTCHYYDVNNYYINDEEVLLNNSTWCYYATEDRYSLHEKYYKNNNKHSYIIDLYTYDNTDGKCTSDFYNFKNSIRVKDE